jgi:hypothetical protein
MTQRIFLFCLIFVITKIIASTADTTKINCTSAIDSLDGCKVYTIADEPAEFPEGMIALQKYIRSNLGTVNMSECAYSTITIELIIDTLGHVRNACVTLPYGNEIVCSKSKNELLKSINDMPAWKPGKLHGKKVYTGFVIPVRISIR